MSSKEIANLPRLEIQAMHGPAPKKLVIKDVRKGTGAELRPGDSMLVDFAGVNYGETIETTSAARNERSRFTFDGVLQSWQEGLPGMRVGGRRELIVPNAVHYENGTVVYMIDLLGVYPPQGGS
jgi:peptidylprolyl isomerase